MKSEERRLTHIAARRLDLRSVSHGKEPNRHMVIKRSRACGSVFFCLSMNETQSLELLPEQCERMKAFIKQFPVEPHHVEDHLSVPDLRSLFLFKLYLTTLFFLNATEETAKCLQGFALKE